jgi:hypothetical protein
MFLAVPSATGAKKIRGYHISLFEAGLFITVETEPSVMIGSILWFWNSVLIGPGLPSAKHSNIIRDLQFLKWIPKAISSLHLVPSSPRLLLGTANKQCAQRLSESHHPNASIPLRQTFPNEQVASPSGCLTPPRPSLLPHPPSQPCVGVCMSSVV